MVNLNAKTTLPEREVPAEDFVISIKNGHYRIRNEAGIQTDAVYFAALSEATKNEIADLMIKGLEHNNYSDIEDIEEMIAYWDARYLEQHPEPEEEI